MPSPRVAPSANEILQPTSSANSDSLSRKIEATAAEGGSHPKGAVDDQVDATAGSSRNQLVDRGVDRRVLAADAGAGEEPHGEEPPRRPSDRGEDGREQVEGQRDQEEPLATEAVGELPEEERPDAGPRDVKRLRQRDVGVGERDAASWTDEGRRQKADDRDLEAVEDPDDAEADHHPPVKARPRQSVEPGRNAGPNRAEPISVLCASGSLHALSLLPGAPGAETTPRAYPNPEGRTPAFHRGS